MGTETSRRRGEHIREKESSEETSSEIEEYRKKDKNGDASDRRKDL